MNHLAALNRADCTIPLFVAENLVMDLHEFVVFTKSKQSKEILKQL